MKIPPRREVTNERIILKINAHQKPPTCIPETKLAASKITKALMTKEKKPNVRIVSGKPKIFRTGVTIKFKIPKTIANPKAE